MPGLKPFTVTTIQEWRDIGKLSEQLTSRFFANYCKSFEDALGNTWRQHWTEKQEGIDTMYAVEDEIERYCVNEGGMKPDTFRRYRNAARRAAFHGTDFNLLKSLPVKYARQAEQIAQTMAGETKEERINAAYKSLATKRRTSHAVTLAERQGNTVLRLPAQDETPAHYCERLACQILAHLDRPEVKAMTSAISAQEAAGALKRIAKYLRKHLPPAQQPPAQQPPAQQPPAQQPPAQQPPPQQPPPQQLPPQQPPPQSPQQ